MSAGQFGNAVVCTCRRAGAFAMFPAWRTRRGLHMLSPIAIGPGAAVRVGFGQCSLFPSFVPTVP